ncbi:hypothetical protein IH979_02820 [Patescibacteria group bacterium]|nr:hypothetical protein [Patescibacteria group bacterium]
MQRTKKWIAWSYGIGLLIVIGSHIYMLAYGLPEAQTIPHAVINLVAAVLLAAAWWKKG